MFFLAALLSEAMAASSGDDIKTQLANILGRPLARIGQIRKTDETPPRISVIDVVIVITGKNPRNAARDVGFLKERYPDVTQKLSRVIFNVPSCCNLDIMDGIIISIIIIDVTTHAIRMHSNISTWLYGWYLI